MIRPIATFPSAWKESYLLLTHAYDREPQHDKSLNKRLIATVEGEEQRLTPSHRPVPKAKSAWHTAPRTCQHLSGLIVLCGMPMGGDTPYEESSKRRPHVIPWFSGVTQGSKDRGQVKGLW